MDFKSFLLEKKEKETADIYSFFFRPKEGDVNNFLPGQFFLIKLNNPNLRPNFKPYSALLPYNPKTLGFGIKIQGQFSRALFELKEGQEVFIAGPFGKFLFKEGEDGVFLAGGIGITPFFCMIASLLLKNYSKKLYLFYSNRVLADVAYKSRLDELAAKNENLKIIYVLTREQKEGFENKRIDFEMIKKYVENPFSPNYYICGSEEFLNGTKSLLEKNSIPKEKISFESW